MKMRDYMKKKESATAVNLERVTNVLASLQKKAAPKRRLLAGVVAVLLVLPLIGILVVHSSAKESDIDTMDLVSMVDVPIAASSSKKSIITIPNGIVKANPFVPYRDITGNAVVPDVPAFNLVEPPEVINENSDAARVMDTIVSGILYDKFSPSAILNIEGNDYLVKKGDVVNNYKVVNIAQDSVTVQLGSNVYKAGIGEILTDGNLNYNNVSNLNSKFGGVK